MDDMVLVTVAAGYTVTIDPHPSGVEGMPPLRLGAEQTLRVTRDEAQRLYDERQIYHPVTGRPKPADKAPPPQPLVTYGRTPSPIPGVQVHDLAPSAEAEMVRRHNAEIDRRNAARAAAGGMKEVDMVSRPDIRRMVQTADDTTGIFAELAREGL
ncbi:hypothetical protein J8J14_09485 [Roseomonas sp. SSH11]|uniref:Uncharacterized protein n=1 Tax=Pararoseomonas baculiformis TaxID=2820812 RepID=A0ABS4ADC0_9PROT|nr:hypothetical protein [Pararoseomonas baculiformis]MBP0445011.1 hypothetical protein [Pararoseomonas baculiformis]